MVVVVMVQGGGLLLLLLGLGLLLLHGLWLHLLGRMHLSGSGGIHLHVLRVVGSSRVLGIEGRGGGGVIVGAVDNAGIESRRHC
ncbi:hypothetical protein B0J12DRAFT_667292, partial [Macrophomina phaseolina]